LLGKILFQTTYQLSCLKKHFWNVPSNWNFSLRHLVFGVSVCNTPLKCYLLEISCTFDWWKCFDDWRKMKIVLSLIGRKCDLILMAFCNFVWTSIYLMQFLWLFKLFFLELQTWYFQVKYYLHTKLYFYPCFLLMLY
jgi:hypothetical protein